MSRVATSSLILVLAIATPTKFLCWAMMMLRRIASRDVHPGDSFIYLSTGFAHDCSTESKLPSVILAGLRSASVPLNSGFNLILEVNSWIPATEW